MARRGSGSGGARSGSGYRDDQGRTWRFASGAGGAARRTGGANRCSARTSSPGPGYVLVTLRTLDDVGADATMGAAYAVSVDRGATWRFGRPVHGVRWRASNLDGVVNGAGLRERAERTASGDVFWAYGDGRLALGRAAGRTAIFGARIHIEVR